MKHEDILIRNRAIAKRIAAKLCGARKRVKALLDDRYEREMIELGEEIKRSSKEYHVNDYNAALWAAMKARRAGDPAAAIKILVALVELWEPSKEMR